MHRIYRPFAASLLLASAACGSLASNTDSPTTLATIHGQVVNPTSVDVGPNGFRVAIVWESLEGDASAIVHSAQETAVTPVFPAQFALDVTEPPPADAMLSDKGGSSIRFAIGALVAYEDTNGNGKLDLVDPHASSFVDRIVASPENVTLMYLEGVDAQSLTGKMADDNGVMPTNGFGFYVLDDCNFQGGDCGGKPGFVWQPVSTPLTLTLTADPQLSALMCQSESGSSSAGGSVTDHPAGDLPATLPAKGDPSVTCAPDGRSFTIQACTSSRDGLCGAVSGQCKGDTYSLKDGEAPPSGWPCGQ